MQLTKIQPQVQRNTCRLPQVGHALWARGGHIWMKSSVPWHRRVRDTAEWGFCLEKAFGKASFPLPRAAFQGHAARPQCPLVLQGSPLPPALSPRPPNTAKLQSCCINHPRPSHLPSLFIPNPNPWPVNPAGVWEHPNASYPGKHSSLALILSSWPVAAPGATREQDLCAHQVGKTSPGTVSQHCNICLTARRATSAVRRESLYHFPQSGTCSEP